jgi:hypothetical protein
MVVDLILQDNVPRTFVSDCSRGHDVVAVSDGGV